MKKTSEQIQRDSEFRSKLWKDFVASYQVVLATAPEKFAAYCAAFREKWVAGQ